MKITFAELWRPSGTIDSGPYALIGVIAFVLKHNLDRFVATFVFHRRWGIFNYWIPVHHVTRITQLGRNDAVLLATLVVIALPFIWLGVVLTIKRLRAAKLPLFLVVLFFAPFLNLFFFLLLSLLPTKGVEASRKGAAPSFLMQIVPRSPLGSALVSLLITVPAGFLLALFGSGVLHNYGWGLFIGVPFAVGFAAATIFEIHESRSLGESVGVASLAVALLGAFLLGFAVEGLFCLVMAIPLALPLAIIGGVCAHGVVRGRRYQKDATAFLAILLFVVPGVEFAEHKIAPPRPVFSVRTAIDIQAPPGKVWDKVVAFSQIDPPTEWMFRAGISYPIRAEMIGTGVGAERHCVFSTGAFVEPIQIWDEPRQLKFSVTSNPAPMEEWTPYSHIEPPHLHGFLLSEGGQFLLTPLPNGGTRLEGTTWYQHGLWPVSYWKLWSDAIIHRIHLRVLGHIQQEVENRPELRAATKTAQ